MVKVAGVFLNPNGITKYSDKPKVVLKVVYANMVARIEFLLHLIFTHLMFSMSMSLAYVSFRSRSEEHVFVSAKTAFRSVGNKIHSSFLSAGFYDFSFDCIFLNYGLELVSLSCQISFIHLTF